MRRISAFATWLRVAALVLVSVSTGCQSNSDRDLIARDRRMQENEIYALQDYVKQYQQLVCRYRAENAALRRQLVEEPPALAAPAGERSLVPPLRSVPPGNSPPEFQTPIPPGAREPQSAPPSTTPPAATPGTTPKNDTLTVPPLKSTHGGRSPRYGDQSSNEGPSDSDSANVLPATYDQLIETSPAGEAATTPGGRSADSQGPTGGSAKPRSASSNRGVRISGEVVANDSGGGPRLMVDVMPAAALGGAESFEGKVSLMLLASGSNGRKRNLGRWDFSRDDVHAARNKSDHEQSLRFFIELPANIAVNANAQLWARLMPVEGGKLLVHTAVDLNQPGSFSSVAVKVNPPVESKQEAPLNPQSAPNDDVVVTVGSNADSIATVGYESSSPPEADNSVAAALNESSWSIATPGKPANLPAEAVDASGHGGWRMSSEPIPTVVQAAAVQEGKLEGKSAHAKLPALKPIPVNEELPVLAAPNPGARPSWSAERTGAVSERTAARPNWSSKR